MKMNLVRGILFSLSVVLLSACSDDNNDSKIETRFEPIPFTASEQAAVDATEPFSLDLFKKYSELSGDPNVAISPLSATFAMAMVANGATGETQSEILTALGFNSESGLEDMNAYAQRLMENLGKEDPSTEAVVANAMFYKEGPVLEKSYSNLLKSDYDADVMAISSDQYVSHISDWISKKTNGAIKKLDLGYQKSNFSLLNAISFRGRWAEPFDKGQTSKYPFISYDGGISNIDYLCDKRQIGLGQNEEWALARLDFGNGAFSIEFLKLLDPIADLDEKLRSFDVDVLGELRNNTKKLEVNLRIPKIDITLKSDLVKTLIDMGIEKVFDFDAQLGGIFQSAGAALYIDHVNQGCTFSIDEDGVVAQVVTVVGDFDIALPIFPGGDFFLDHPFVFAIRENSSGAILFMGKIGKL